MTVLGIKCSKQELGWIVVEGTTRTDATVVASERVKTPAGERGEQLAWKELLEVVVKHTPDVATLGMSAGKPRLRSGHRWMEWSLYQKEIAVERLFSASIRSRFFARDKAEVEAAVAG
jgi:hypothetical protein